MHDRIGQYSMNEPDPALAAALRALPGQRAPDDAWPKLAARARRRRHARRALWAGVPAALAAGIALAVLWPHSPLQHAAQPSPPLAQQAAPAPASGQQALATLQASSREWQAWVATLGRDGAPLDGNALATSVALQDRIGLIDLQLSAVRDPAIAASLWRQRIDLLQRLGWLHLEPYAVAARNDVQRPATTPM